jgi:hypothetical protein
MALIFAWNRQTELTCSAEFPVHHLTCLQDFKDLFSTLMVSLPLTSHRVRFSRHEHSFTTDEALTNLGSLKFSQSNRMPDPKDPTRIVTTTTTTTGGAPCGCPNAEELKNQIIIQPSVYCLVGCSKYPFFLSPDFSIL